MGLKVAIIVLGILLALVTGALIALGSTLTYEVKRLKKLLSDTQFQKTALEKKNILLNSEIEKIQIPYVKQNQKNKLQQLAQQNNREFKKLLLG